MTAEPTDVGVRMCMTFVDSLPVDGASIVLFDGRRNQTTIGTSDQTAARADALQLELGEGPHWDALGTAAPSLCPDLDRAAAHGWPLFTAAVRLLGIAAVFAFPMRLGTAVVGAVDLYCLEPVTLDPVQLSLARYLADTFAVAAVRAATRSADDPRSRETAAAPALRREVHQATGMIQAQLDIDSSDAFARLRAHAFATARPIELIAQDIVTGRLDFSTLTGLTLDPEETQEQWRNCPENPRSSRPSSRSPTR